MEHRQNTPRTPKQDRAEATRNKLLKAALEMFSEHGYHGTDTKKIAARAGVAVGTLYRWFTDKKTLFLALCERMDAQVGDDIFETGARLFALHGPDRALESLMHHAVEAHRKNRRFHREVLAMTLTDPDTARMSELREERIRKRLAAFLESMRDTLRPEVLEDLEAAAEMVYMAVEETAHKAVVFDSPLGEKRLTAELSAMVGRYLLKPGGMVRIHR